jgi:hypothetical protein
MFNLPVKEIIVNDDTQVILKEDDGTAYADNDVVIDTSGGFILDGFINEILWGSKAAADANTMKGTKNSYLRFIPNTTSDCMIKTAASNGNSEGAAFAFTAAAGAKKGDTYRLVLDSLDLTPTEFQNRPVEKRYQLSVDCANPAAIVAELVAQINADAFAPVTAYAGFSNASPVQDDTNKIVLVGKTAYIGCSVNLYVGTYADSQQTTYTVSLTKSAAGATVYDTAEDGVHTIQLAALPVNTYAALKNINWAKNFTIDQNINWMPLPGQQYTSYYFEVVTRQLQTQLGGNPSPGEVNNDQVYAVRLYVNNNSAPTLLAAMNLLEVDLG